MSKLRLLIADDEEGIRESLKLLLEREYEVTLADNGQEAWEWLSRDGFDLAVLDIKMPKLDGLEILKRMKRQRIETPVLMLTAYQSVELAKEAVKLGAVDYVTKPFDSTQVLDAIHDVVAKK